MIKALLCVFLADNKLTLVGEVRCILRGLVHWDGLERRCLGNAALVVVDFGDLAKIDVVFLR